jgi:hypothetical protein
MFPIVSLRTMTADSFDPETLRTRVADINAPVTMTLCGLLPLSEEGESVL